MKDEKINITLSQINDIDINKLKKSIKPGKYTLVEYYELLLSRAVYEAGIKNLREQGIECREIFFKIQEK